MADQLYRLADTDVTPFTEEQYVTESILQEIISNNPSLILLPDDPSDYQLFLVRREHQVESDSGSHYYLDILFVDSDSVPVIVEVKRSSDSRIHGPVLSQIIDYSARLQMMDFDSIVSGLKEHTGDELFDELMTGDFLDQLKANIENQVMRLVIAADTIPPELERMILFLDSAMTKIKLYGVSLTQYRVGESHVISRSVHVNNSPAVQKKSQPKHSVWTFDNLRQKFFECDNADAVPLLERLLKLAEACGLDVGYGTGALMPRVFIKRRGYWVLLGCFGLSHGLRGIGYLQFNTLSELRQDIFPTVSSVTDFLYSHGFDPGELKEGKTNITFYMRLIANDNNYSALSALLSTMSEA